MKKMIFSVAAVAIAIVSVAFAKANPKMFQPVCPEGTEVFYFQPDSESFANGTATFNALNTTNNWLITPPNAEEDCGGEIRVCAICAPVLDPSAAILRPDLSGSNLQGKFQDYSINRNVSVDDQEPSLFFERNGQ